MEKLGDLRISGMGKMNGGKFDDVDISGMGKIFGGIEARNIKISGSGKIEGGAKATRMIVSGNATVQGDLESENIESSGNFKTEGNVKTQKLSNSGRVRVDGDLKAQRVDSKGMLTIGGGVETEEFYSDGVFKIGGLLNSNTVDVKIQWDSYAREIGGEMIKIRRSRHIGFSLFYTLFSKWFGLQADVIEGTEVYLEYTKAKIVRGNKVKIGPECEIEQVEYTDSIEIAAGSKVKNQLKI